MPAWAITLPALHSLVETLPFRLAAAAAAPAELASMFGGAGAAPQLETPGGNVAVIQVRGPITHHPDFWALLFGGGASVDIIERQLAAAAADASVKAILLDFDTPGGSSGGVVALGNTIRGMRGEGKKPIVSLANGQCCSAGLWLASQADAYYATPGSLTGSLGVYYMHLDMSEAAAQAGVKVTYITAGAHKADGNSFEPLSDAAQARHQAIVNDIYDDFVGNVAKGRGLTRTKVLRDFGEGAVLTAREALAVGMIDGIVPFEVAVKRALGMKSRAPGTPAEPAPADDDDDPKPAAAAAGADPEARTRLRRMRLHHLQAEAAHPGG